MTYESSWAAGAALNRKAFDSATLTKRAARGKLAYGVRTSFDTTLVPARAHFKVRGSTGGIGAGYDDARRAVFCSACGCRAVLRCQDGIKLQPVSGYDSGRTRAGMLRATRLG